MNKDFVEIVYAAKSSDNRAFEALYNMTKDSAYFIALSITKNEQDAMDILQDSYIKAFENIHTVNPPEMFDNWLNRIVSNESKNWLKKKKPVLFADINTDIPPEWNEEELNRDYIPHESVDSKETSRIVMEIINGLSEEKRLVVLMHYYQDMSVAEISETLELPVTTVKYKLLSARKEIKKAIEDLEKKGTKLYSVAPLAILPAALTIYAANYNAPAFSAGILGGLSSGTSAVSSTVGTTNVTAKTTGGINMILKTTMSKVIAAAIAVVIVGGGVTAAVVIGNSNNTNNTAVSQNYTLENSVDLKTNEQPSNEESEDMLDVLKEESYPNSEISEVSEIIDLPESPTEDFDYEINGDNVTIIEYLAKDDTVVIPQKIEDKAVTTIGECAFIFNFSVITLIIPDGVTNIEGCAFMSCVNLHSVTIPDSVTTISGSAFQKCETMSDITIPDSVTNIGEGAFFDCTNLTDITIPDSVTSIGEYAFGYYFEDSTTKAKLPDFVIHGKAGSAAETYANENGITFIAE